MTKEEKNKLDEIKKEYSKFNKKYKLPDFHKLNTIFDIEDIDINTEFFLRRLRRSIAERISGYLRFIEIILNPSNAPMFFFKLVRKLEVSDRENLMSLYEKISKFELDMIELDLEYDEIKEAKFINKAYELFSNEVKNELLNIIKKLGNGEGFSSKENNAGSYFG